MDEQRARRTTALVLGILVVMVASGVTSFPGARSARAAVTSQTVLASADALVERSNPSRNVGTSTTLVADNSPVVESYVRFAVGSVAGTVTRAIVRLYVTNSSVDGPAVYPASNDWAERAITWNARPPRTGAVLADSARVTSGSWVAFDVSRVVQGSGTFTFNLAGPSTDSTVVVSREGTSTRRPQLVLTVDGGTTAPTTSAAPTTTAPATTSAVPTTTAPATTSTAPTTTAPATTVAPPLSSVFATVETPPVPHAGDAADDPAVWANTSAPASSAVVATDKLGGLLVYDMAGTQLQYLAVGKVNNVDVRPTAGTAGGLTLSGRPVVLAVAGNRTDNTIRVYELDPTTRQLRDVAARTITPGITVYGSCLYRSAATGRLFVFVNSKTGQVEQWELFDNGAGKVDAARVRSFTVGTQTEGCVADDEVGSLYIGEELVGIWKYGAEPTSGTARTSVAAATSAGPLVPQVEGLSIAYGPNGTGYLIASSQGSNSFTVYRREGANEFVKAFRVVAGGAIDGAEGTDGLDVSTAPLGPGFPFGALVVQDGSNDSGNQNFKFVPWQSLGLG